MECNPAVLSPGERGPPGTVILYHAIGIICQTFFYGIYACLAIFSIYLMVKTGLQTGIRKFLFIMSIFMFFISTLYWISRFLDLLMGIQNHFIASQHVSTSLATSLVSHSELILGAVVLINYALTDAVVLWRAWVLCSVDYRKWLYVPLFFLWCSCVSIFATITIRVTIQSMTHVDGSTTDPRIKPLTRALDVCQVANLAFSLLLNLSATGLIAYKAWQFRRWIKFELKAIRGGRTRGEKIMALLIESGVLYCISVISTLVFAVIRLPVGTLGDFYTPVNIQIAGMYPLVVLLLVNHGRSLEQTMFGKDTTNNAPRSMARISNDHRTLETIRFRSNAPRSASLLASFSHLRDRSAV
ncbi:hypothetical protein L218DRAFT_910207 [Marasmius fiardii PR-910]|nr:hypothetical protein L218DRAFT_910207 [Marasmius fiardii PR-910]